MFGYVYIICTYMYIMYMVYSGVYACVYMYISGVCTCTGACLDEFMCLVACCSDLDPFGEIRTRYWRFGVVLVMDPIHRRFEDRSVR